MSWRAVLHVDPMANSYVPKMTVVAEREGKLIGYCAVPQDLTVLNDEVALAALLRKHMKYR